MTEKNSHRSDYDILFKTLCMSCLSSDSSYEYPSPYSVSDGADYSEGLKPMKPFGMDLDVTSNRSSIISQVNVPVL
jgi:hypothetical protein